MYEFKGMNGESIVIDGAFIEKHRGIDQRGRIPATRYEGLDVSTFTKRRFLAFGEKTEMLQIVINAGTFLAIQVPKDREGEIEELRARLERAKLEAAED